MWSATAKGHNQNLHTQCQIFTLNYLCSHYTVKTCPSSVEWESHLGKSSLLTYMPLVERLANKLSTVNYALIQVPMWCVSVWIHLHMSRYMYVYEHKCLSSLFTSLSYIGTVSITTAMLLFRHQESHLLYRLGYTCFFPLFLIISVKRLSPWYPLPTLPLTSEKIQPYLYMCACWTSPHKMPITSLFCLNIFISPENLKYTNMWFHEEMIQKRL